MKRIDLRAHELRHEQLHNELRWHLTCDRGFRLEEDVLASKIATMLMNYDIDTFEQFISNTTDRNNIIIRTAIKYAKLRRKCRSPSRGAWIETPIRGGVEPWMAVAGLPSAPPDRSAAVPHSENRHGPL